MKNEKTLYPLTSAQHLLYYAMKFSLKPAVINISTMTHFESDISPELMLEATRLALKRNRSSSTRLVKVKGEGIKQYFSDEEPQGLEILDFSKKSEKDFEKFIQKASGTAFPNHALETQLYNIKLIKKCGGSYALFMCVNHIALDAYAIMQMVSDILKIYAALRDKQPIPENKNNPLPALELDQKYAQSPRRERDIDFWANEVFKTEPHYTSVTGLKYLKKGHRYGTTLKMLHPGAKHINKTLDKKIVDAVNDYARDNMVSPQCVYMLALRNFLSMESEKQEDVMINQMLTKRTNKGLKNAGCTLAQAIEIRLNISNKLRFKEACAAVNNLSLRYYRHSGLSTLDIKKYGESKYKKPIPCGYISTNFTYQPYMVEKVEGVPVHFSIHSTGANTMPLYLTVIGLDYSGNLTFNYDFNTGFVSDDDIGKMHKYIVKFLTKALENPDLTLEELMN